MDQPKKQKKRTAYSIHNKRSWFGCTEAPPLKEIEIKIKDHKIHLFFSLIIIYTFENRSKRSKDWSAGAIYGPSPCKKVLSLFVICPRFSWLNWTVKQNWVMLLELNILITKTPHTAILCEFWVALYSNQ